MNTGMLKYIGLGALLLWFVIAGRLFCGRACPLGFIQELLYKIPFWVKIKTFKFDRPLRVLKYAHFVYNFVLPALVVLGFLKAFEAHEMGTPFYIVLAVIAVIIRRPFCKYVCAIGAASSLFNKFSWYRYKMIDGQCVKCGICTKKCPMNIIPYTMKNSPECIRCGICKRICPKKAFAKNKEGAEYA
ncbi:MAG: 4Fe-4S binding protein [Treponema sp.]|nr:4Fe-4S binding protein [Treponema sp.]